MRNTKWRWMAVLALFALVLGACSSSDDGGDDSADDTDDSTEETVELTQDGGKLAAVQEAGTLVCGVNEGVPGFGFLEEDGRWEFGQNDAFLKRLERRFNGGRSWQHRDNRGADCGLGDQQGHQRVASAG